jgi:hypothetical protein
MGYKNVCLNCFRVENLGTDYEKFRTGKCPECSHAMTFVNHKFRPPKKNDKKGWELVKFLISHGFNFQHVSDENGIYVTYPRSMEEAKEFVKKYEFRGFKN